MKITIAEDSEYTIYLQLEDRRSWVRKTIDFLSNSPDLWIFEIIRLILEKMEKSKGDYCRKVVIVKKQKSSKEAVIFEEKLPDDIPEKSLKQHLEQLKNYLKNKEFDNFVNQLIEGKIKIFNGEGI